MVTFNRCKIGLFFTLILHLAWGCDQIEHAEQSTLMADPCLENNGVTRCQRNARVVDFDIGIAAFEKWHKFGRNTQSWRGWEKFDPIWTTTGNNPSSTLVHGPYEDLAAAGSISAEFHMHANALTNQISANDEVFTIDITGDSGKTSIASRTYYFKEFSCENAFGNVQLCRFQGQGKSNVHNYPLMRQVTIAGRVDDPTRNIEMRIRDIHPNANVGIGRIRATYTKDK